LTEYSASYDKATKIVTSFVVILFLTISIAAHNLILLMIGALILLFGYLYSPRGYTITADALVVKRAIGNVTIPLAAITEVRGATISDLSGTIRLWGSGGLFGHYGAFRTSRLGRCTWYVTDRDQCAIVRTAKKTIVISPDDVDGFLKAMPVRGGEAPDFELLQENLTPKLVAGVGFALPVALVVAAFLYSPVIPGYTLTPTGLSIHDRFYPVTLNADSVDTTDMRVVDLSTDPHWRPVMRTGGFANTYYKAGWFRVAGGEKVRLYRTTSTRVVLLPPKGNGTPVLYQAAEPEQFINEVRREWTSASRR
jgi:hypothetical protein